MILHNSFSNFLSYIPIENEHNEHILRPIISTMKKIMCNPRQIGFDKFREYQWIAPMKMVTEGVFGPEHWEPFR